MTTNTNDMCIVCKTMRPIYFNIFTSEERPLLDKRLSKVLSVNLTLYRGQKLVICDECANALEKIEILELLKAEFVSKFRRRVTDSKAVIANPPTVTHRQSNCVSCTPVLHCNASVNVDHFPFQRMRNECLDNKKRPRLTDQPFYSSYKSTQNQKCYFLRSSKSCDGAEENCEIHTSKRRRNCRSRLKELLLTRSASSGGLYKQDDEVVIDVDFSDEAKEMLKNEDASASIRKVIETINLPANSVNLIECSENLSKQISIGDSVNTDTQCDKESHEINSSFPLEEIPLDALNKILILPSNKDLETNPETPDGVNSAIHTVTVNDVTNSTKAVSYDLNIVMQDVSKEITNDSNSNYHCKPLGELRLKITKDSLQPLCEISEENLDINSLPNANLIDEGLDLKQSGIIPVVTDKESAIRTCTNDKSDCNSQKYSEMSWNNIYNSKENFPLHIRIRDYLERCGTIGTNGYQTLENCSATKNKSVHMKNTDSLLSHDLVTEDKNSQFIRASKVDLFSASPQHDACEGSDIVKRNDDEIKIGSKTNVFESKLNSTSVRNPVTEVTANNVHFESRKHCIINSNSSKDPFEFTDADSPRTDESIPFLPVYHNGKRIGDNEGNVMKIPLQKGYTQGRKPKIGSYLRGRPCRQCGVSVRGGYRKRGRKRKYSNFSVYCKHYRREFSETANESTCAVNSLNHEIELPLSPILETNKCVAVYHNEIPNTIALLEPSKIKQEKTDEPPQENNGCKQKNVSEGGNANQNENQVLQLHEIKKEIIVDPGEIEALENNGKENEDGVLGSSTLIIEPQKNQLMTLKINEKGATMIYYKEISAKQTSKSANDLSQDPIGIVLFHIGLCRDRFEGILWCGSCTQPSMFTEFASYEMHLNICHQRCLLYACSKCGVRSKSAFAAESHLIQTHWGQASRNVYSTNDTNSCINSTRDNKNFTQHLTNNVPGSLTKDANANRFMCGICNAIFSSHKECFDHMDIHSNSNEFLCDKCALSFPTLDLLKTHSMLHNVAPIS